MRSMVLATAVVLAWPAVGALAQNATAHKPEPKPRPPAGQSAANPNAVNPEARRLEDERHKRWDERMRRTTRSLCDRC